MQESIFDIFGSKGGTQSQLHVSPASSNAFSLKGVPPINIPGKTGLLTNTNKKALGDVGNTLPKSKTLQETSKIVIPNVDQENASAKLAGKTPLQKPKLAENTPNMKPGIRTPLSDVKPKEQKQTLKPSNTAKKTNKSVFMELHNFLTDGFCDDLSIWEHDECVHTDCYEDVLPDSMSHAEEDICRLVNFWEMGKETYEFESDPELPLQDEPDLFGPTGFLDADLEEPLPVPLFPEDDLII